MNVEIYNPDAEKNEYENDICFGITTPSQTPPWSAELLPKP